MSPRQQTHLAYVGLGANLGEPVEMVRAGIDALGTMPETRLRAVSSLYRTPPMGPIKQPDFINAVAAIETILAPLVLLSRLQSIEERHGRVRDGVRWGPRTLDLDILLYEDWQIAEETLTIPHPGLHRRAFVLYPLCEIAPYQEVPGRGPVWMLRMNPRMKRASGAPFHSISRAGSLFVPNQFSTIRHQ